MKLKNIKKIGRKFHLQVAFRCPLTLGLCLPSASRTPAKSCLRHSSTLSAVFPTRNHSPATTSKIRLPPVKKKKYFYNKTKLLQPKKTFLLLMLSVTVSTMATAALNLGMWKISENISSSSLYLSKRTKSSFASELRNVKLW